MIIKQLSNIDIARIREIDRTEHVTLGYVYADGDLKAEAVDWQIPRWKKDDPERGVEGRIRVWSPYLKNGGVLIGALEDDLLVGFIIFRPKLTETVAQLAVLHVSKDFRRRGIAREPHSTSHPTGKRVRGNQPLCLGYSIRICGWLLYESGLQTCRRGSS